MDENQQYSFFVGELEDGRFCAWRPDAPSFLVVRDSEKKAVGEATAILDCHRRLLDSGKISGKVPLGDQEPTEVAIKSFSSSEVSLSSKPQVCFA